MKSTTKSKSNQVKNVSPMKKEHFNGGGKPEHKKQKDRTANPLEIKPIIETGDKTLDDVLMKRSSFSWKDVEVGRRFVQNDRIRLVTDDVLVIGMDIGSEKHDARAFDSRGIEYSDATLEFSNTQEGFSAFDQWARSTACVNRKQRIIVGMEPTGHYWFNVGSWLMKHDYTVVHVNPHHVKKSKELDDNSQNKTDQKDPKVIAGLVNAGRYFMTYLPEGINADLRNATNQRLVLTEEMTRLKNRMHRWIDIYFPEYTEIYKDICSRGSLLLLKKAALPSDILSLGADGINQIWRDARLRGSGKVKAKAIIEAASRSIGGKEGLTTARIEIENYVDDYNMKCAQYNRIITELDKLSGEIPYMDNILEIRGLGIRIITGIASEIGDISRFDDAKRLQKMAGLSLVENSSGKHAGQKIISKRGRRRLRYLLYQAALQLIRMNNEFQRVYQYYITRPEHPLKKMQALMLIACKLLRVLYAMMTKGIRYDPQKLLKDIRHPGTQAA